ncbi:MAG: hypothetical protein EZS28_048607, partial [Streblomastix strix]
MTQISCIQGVTGSRG